MGLCCAYKQQLLTSTGFAGLSAAFATGCSTADDVCRRAADKACGAWVARNRPGRARSSIWLVTEHGVIWLSRCYVATAGLRTQLDSSTSCCRVGRSGNNYHGVLYVSCR
jgi:hypothetical protein